ncbi:MAG TPA: hypothetical protein PLQ38_00250, partial [Methanothrix sp.]|nr:hypothetical protein [Methanothrix sp.]
KRLWLCGYEWNIFLSNFGEARPIAQIVESTILIERKVLSEYIQLNFLLKLPQSEGVCTITVTTHPTNPQLLVKMCEYLFPRTPIKLCAAELYNCPFYSES